MFYLWSPDRWRNHWEATNCFNSFYGCSFVGSLERYRVWNGCNYLAESLPRKELTWYVNFLWHLSLRVILVEPRKRWKIIFANGKRYKSIFSSSCFFPTVWFCLVCLCTVQCARVHSCVWRRRKKSEKTTQSKRATYHLIIYFFFFLSYCCPNTCKTSFYSPNFEGTLISLFKNMIQAISDLMIHFNFQFLPLLL